MEHHSGRHYEDHSGLGLNLALQKMFRKTEFQNRRTVSNIDLIIDSNSHTRLESNHRLAELDNIQSFIHSFIRTTGQIKRELTI